MTVACSPRDTLYLLHREHITAILRKKLRGKIIFIILLYLQTKNILQALHLRNSIVKLYTLNLPSTQETMLLLKKVVH
jgi:hypothetical protein